MTLVEMVKLVHGYSEFLKANRSTLTACKILALEAEIKLWRRTIQIATFIKTRQNYLYPVRINRYSAKYVGFEHLTNGNDRIIVKNIHKLNITINPTV